MTIVLLAVIAVCAVVVAVCALGATAALAQISRATDHLALFGPGKPDATASRTKEARHG